MSTSEQAQPAQAPTVATGQCPFDHKALLWQQNSQHTNENQPAIECDAQGVWHVRGFDEARAILRSSNTKQAGFNAEMVDKASASLTNKPILYQEGKVHHQQRKQTARFFTPKT